MKSFQAPLAESSTIKLNMTHSVLSMRIPDIRFDLYQSIADVKKNAVRRFGTDYASMQLILRDLNGNNIAAMTEDDRTLVSYCPQEGYTIHVLDMNPESITHELEDLSQVEKYVISDEDYDKLPGAYFHILLV
eukprot:TRINITY_DN3708_c0_g2_i15.p1 TRINITY_DN3708_c0_g2~~TRINITY_DN3708_c0_g2_i15.p1  ORF type:complete len:133 (+),score=37.20 TRINITY_DN3708_c0_g2_i15:127-525(+)